VLQLLAEGMTNAEIGTRLGVSARTVKTHVQNLLAKLDTPDRTGAVARGFRLGLIS
jgi:DNA-binding NarL/FixJ family response regulator